MAPRGGACHHFPPGTGVWEDTTGCWLVPAAAMSARAEGPLPHAGCDEGALRHTGSLLVFEVGCAGPCSSRCWRDAAGGRSVSGLAGGRGGCFGWARPGYPVWSWVAVTPVMAILSRLVTAQAKDSSAWTAVRPRRAKRRSPRRSLSQALGASLMGARRL